ncbi:DUF4181 domain-containing protein [Gracilibacillus saliphilus]|uniref:DUF4181 domain-containing protein n=1 Tax=Gracilibacillus saliphilus TaxID=543890 RepID=UPI0013D0412A|nr:DUF4181 domain-containing protein [Gracilibacillus saliphilus]
MIVIIVILFCIFIMDQLINRKLIKKMNMEEADLEKRYVNKTHKYVENILHWATLLLIPASITGEYHRLRLFLFIVPSLMFAFRAMMKWKFATDNQTYLLSAVTCVLFITGSIVYGSIHFGIIT